MSKPSSSSYQPVPSSNDIPNGHDAAAVQQHNAAYPPQQHAYPAVAGAPYLAYPVSQGQPLHGAYYHPAPAAHGAAPAPMWLPPQPIPGLMLKGPRLAPEPGQVLLSYEVCEADVGCCRCSDLNTTGIVSIVLLLMLCWPLAWLPCLMGECHQGCQRPVYGFPPSQAQPSQGPHHAPHSAMNMMYS